MKSLKYRRKIRRNVPLQDDKLSIADEKMDEKNSCLNTLYQIRINPFDRYNIYLTNFLVGLNLYTDFGQTNLGVPKSNL